jgi:uncharacterized protein YbcI
LSSQEQCVTGGELNHAIANAVVHNHRLYVGRGPTNAQAFFHHNIVVVVMHGVLTEPETKLVAQGRPDAVLDLRRQFEPTLRRELVGAVERLTGCQVCAFISGNQIEPDVEAEVFVLDRPVSAAPLSPTT